MLTHSLTRTWLPLLAALALVALGSSARAQVVTQQPLHFEVSGPSQRLEMIVHQSRVLTVAAKIPRAAVNNEQVVQLTPLSPNQIQISALQPGVTQVNLWDEHGEVHSLDVVVFGDARQLEMLLAQQFPTSTIQVQPLNSGVSLSGTVDNPDDVSRMISIAEDYYPTVVNNITVAGVQQVLLHVEIMEVSRTKLDTLGFDWAQVSGSDFVIQSISGLLSAVAADGGTVTGVGGATMRFGLVDGNNSFFGFIEALRRNNLAKLLANPTLVAQSGRPASFNSGGEVPTLIPGGLGTVTVEYRQFGTRVDFVPIVMGNGMIHLEVRPQVSELDPANSITVDNISVPGFRTRWVDTAVEMQAGQTLAIAGLIQTRVDTESKGLPWLMDLPWVGTAFRRVSEEQNEIELLIMVTPELVEPMDRCEVPPGGPGLNSTSPSQCELLLRGHMEVPDMCAPGYGGGYQGYPQGGQYYSEPGYEQIPTPSTPRSTMPQPESGASIHRLPSETPQLPVVVAPPVGASRPTVAPAVGDQNALQDHYQRQNQQTRPVSTTQAESQQLFGPIGYGDLE